MPSQRTTRSKEDTWTTDELRGALNKTGERRHHRDKDEDRKKERINGEDRHRRRKEEDSDRHQRRDDEDKRRRHKDEDRRSSRHRDEEESGRRLTEEEREKQRQERRDKREGKSKDKGGKGEISFRAKGDDKEIELADLQETSQRRHHSDRERRHKDDHDRDRHHRNGEEDRDKRRRHREEEQNEEDEKEKRRQERRRERESKEDEERRRRHEEKKERRKKEDEDRERRHEEKKERRREDDRDRRKEDRSDRHKRDKERESEREKEERREREREERRREKEERERHGKKSKSSHQEAEVKQEEKEEEDDYGAYDDDFEDYDDDFEDDDDDGGDDGTNIKGSIHKERRPGTKLEYSDSEVNDVLLALDAENERLLNESRSPQVDYGRGRGSRDSDEDDDSDDKYEKTYQSRSERPKTAINFVSAKQRAMNRKTASKTMQRGQDLLKMLELDFASFDILDMPPVNEYDLYIRAFGTSNTTQSYVQTNDDNIERDVQTEEMDMRQKWTQHPPEDFAGCGRGDGEKDVEEEEESLQKHNKEQDMGRLNKFLEKAGQVIAILLEEGKEEEGGDRGKSQSHINISDGYTQLDLLPILQGRHVIHSHFSPVQPNLLLTAYSPAPEVTPDNPVSKRGIICVWNTNEPNYPQKILACSSQPQCCCFSPVKPSLVFAGMMDGSIAMWDLREPSALHRSTVVNDEEYSLRYPTYDTAGVLNEENHHSPVSCIAPIYSYLNNTRSDNSQSQASEDTSSGMSFQLVSTEESAVLHFWVVADIGSADISGSQNDFGLAPGGSVKLLKSSSLTLENPSKDSRLQTSLRALDMKLLPSDPNQFYVSTDSGTVIHGLRFGKRAFPRAHLPVIETIVDVVSIDFSPFEQPCFLAGCSDGSFSLYHTKSENPLITWTTITKGKAVQCIRWSRSRPCVFYILDVASTLYIFDLLEGDGAPKQVETISKERVKSFTLTNDHKANGLGTPGKNPQILFSLENGNTEIHTVSKSLTEPEQLETDYLGSYLQRF